MLGFCLWLESKRKGTSTNSLGSLVVDRERMKPEGGLTWVYLENSHYSDVHMHEHITCVHVCVCSH